MPKLHVVTTGKPLPAAPYPSDTRARDWRFELDMERVWQSDTWAICPAEIRPWLLMMWAESWRCTPVGSYPNDDTIIAARIGMPMNLFRAHQDVLMRGWVLHDDGRIYHPVVGERVRQMIDWRSKEQERVRKWREKRATEKNQGDTSDVTRNERVGHASITTPAPAPAELQKPKPKARSRPASAPEPQVDLPPWLNANDWQAFLAHRINIRKPMNAEAQRRAVIRLGRFRREGHDPNKVLDLSIVNGWQGLFTDNETKAGQDLGALIAELTAKGK